MRTSLERVSTTLIVDTNPKALKSQKKAKKRLPQPLETTPKVHYGPTVDVLILNNLYRTLSVNLYYLQTTLTLSWMEDD